MGQGSVTGGGINCATGNTGTCSAPAFDGTSVSLTAAPGSTSAGSQILFGGWGSDCTTSGTMTTCVLSINAAKNVSAGFTLQHRLSLTVTGAGAGTITANPGAFTCSASTCTRFYDAGSNLMVAAAGTSSLDGVGTVTGDCSAMPCTINSLSAPRSVTVSFVRFQCVPGAPTCTGGQATQCDASGNFVAFLVPNGAADGSAAVITMNNYQCPMGCHATQPICADVNASNGLNAALDTVAASPAGTDVALPRSSSVPAGTVVISTDSYNSMNGTTTITDADGTPIVIPAQVISQGSGYPEILVLKTRSFTIRPGRAVVVNGLRALAIVARFDIFIAGSRSTSLELAVVLVGGAGQSLSSSCVGGVSINGVGGSGNGTSGGNGGGATSGGAALPASVAPLQGGCPDINSGGSGGGALQFISRTRIALVSGAMLNMSGGRAYVAASIGMGGGAGGSTVLEAPSILLSAGATIAGRGGSGASASSSGASDGNDGPTTGTAGAAAVTCTGCGTSGAGGTEASGPGQRERDATCKLRRRRCGGSVRHQECDRCADSSCGRHEIFHGHGTLQARSP